jgi:hypothetical protein
MGIPTERFGVANLDQWGRLVKSWATHLDYVHLQGSPEPPRAYWVNTTWGNKEPPAPATKTDLDANGNPEPWCLPSGSSVVLPRAGGGTSTLPFAVAMTAEDFQKRVAAAGVTITKMPAQYTDVIIVQGAVGTMVMRLPPKDTLQGSEDDLISSVAYPFPQFYEQLYGAKPNVPPLTDRPAIMELHANRIGEYTLNNCA